MTLKIVNFMSAHLSMIPSPFFSPPPPRFPSLSSAHLRCFAVRRGGEDGHHAV